METRVSISDYGSVVARGDHHRLADYQKTDHLRVVDRATEPPEPLVQGGLEVTTGHALRRE